MHVPGYIRSSDDENLLTQWQTMGAIGKAIVPPLALITGSAHFLNAYLCNLSSQRYRFLAAGVLALAMLPYTILALSSTNIELGRRQAKKDDGPDSGLKRLNIRELITRWGDLSAVRGFLMLASTIVSYDAILRFTF